jgi:hypothetical protein
MYLPQVGITFFQPYPTLRRYLKEEILSHVPSKATDGVGDVTCWISFEETLQISNGMNKWEQSSLVDCNYSWIIDKSKKSFKALLCYVIWGIWILRNTILF